MNDIFVRTRKLTMRQIDEVDRWLDANATGAVTIRGIHYKRFIQSYIAENDGNKKIHVLKVSFFNETDARHFLMDWG